jgi:hypothetical protein
LVLTRPCKGITTGGDRCAAPSIRESDFCFWHDPDHVEEAEQARKLGGQRRRRDKVTEGTYELEGIDSVAALRRVLQIAILDALGLENSIARSRVLITGVLAGAKLLEVGEMEERMAAVEAALGPRVAGKRR